MSEESTAALAEVILRIQREIQQLRGTAHILTPMARTKIDSVAIGKIPVLRIATIDPNPDHGEVYPIRQIPGKFALTKVGLMRLEAIAGITGWTTKVEHATKNNAPDPLHIKVTAYAEIEDIDGTIRGKPQTFELDLNDGSPQAEKMVNKYKDGKVVKDYKELTQARVNIVRLAESKAMNAVRRDLLNLQGTFSQAELKKPFVIMRLVDAPLNPNDPLVKKLLVMKQLKITSEMYDSALSSLPTPVEAPVLLPEPERPQIPGPLNEKKLPAATDEELKNATEQAVKAELIKDVEALYRRKVRGGRDANKPSLDSLTTDELAKIKQLLEPFPDIK